MYCSLPGSSVHGIIRQEYWSGLPFPSPGDLPDPGIEPGSPTLQVDSLPNELPGKPQEMESKVNFKGEDYMYVFWNQAQRRETRLGWKLWQTLPSLSLISYKLEILRKHKSSCLVTRLWKRRFCNCVKVWLHTSYTKPIHKTSLPWRLSLDTQLRVPAFKAWAPWQQSSRRGWEGRTSVGFLFPVQFCKQALSAHSPSPSTSGLWFLSTPEGPW